MHVNTSAIAHLIDPSNLHSLHRHTLYKMLMIIFSQCDTNHLHHLLSFIYETFKNSTHDCHPHPQSSLTNNVSTFPPLSQNPFPPSPNLNPYPQSQSLSLPSPCVASKFLLPHPLLLPTRSSFPSCPSLAPLSFPGAHDSSPSLDGIGVASVQSVQIG